MDVVATATVDMEDGVCLLLPPGLVHLALFACSAGASNEPCRGTEAALFLFRGKAIARLESSKKYRDGFPWC
jgi:hypothetical protein